MRRIAPYLILLSIVANVGFAAHLYGRDEHLNRITWGNYVDEFWQHADWASHDMTPRPDGRMVTPLPDGAWLAIEDLHALQSLPHYGRRAEFADTNTLRHFLQYAIRSMRWP